MSWRQTYNIFVLDITSVLLILFGFLTTISGLCLTKPEVVERVTLGLFSSHVACSRIHLGWTTITTIVVAIIHGAAGFDLWLMKTGRDVPWVWLIALLLSIWFLYIYLV
ncbi:MAG: hypothetical protein QW792_01685 [Pyrobaculum sp.]